MRPEGSRQRKVPMTPSGIEPTTSRLLSQCLNQMSLVHLPSSPAFEAGTSLNNAHKAVPASQNRVLIVRNNPLKLYRDKITPYCVGIMQVI